MRWWRGSALAVVLAGFLLGSVPAYAHTSLTASSPGNGETLDSTPTRVRLVFSHPVHPDLSRVAVLINGAPVKPAPVTSQGRSITISLPYGASRYQGAYRLVYQVVYRVVGQDGHRVDGQIQFTVTGSPSGTPPNGTPAGSETSGPPGMTAVAPVPASGGHPAGKVNTISPTRNTELNPLWWLAGLGAVLLLLVLAYVLTIGRNRGKDTSTSAATSSEPDHRGDHDQSAG